MAMQKQDDQHEHTFSSYVRIRDVVLKTYLERWTIGRSGERGSGISVLPARYDDDDDLQKTESTLGYVSFNYYDNLNFSRHGFRWIKESFFMKVVPTFVWFL